MQAKLLNLFSILYHIPAQPPFNGGESPALAVLSFSRNLLHPYASLFPIIFLSVVVILLWCTSSIWEVSVSYVKSILATLYVCLLTFYIFSTNFISNYSIFGTIIAANEYIWFGNVALIVFAFLVIWLRGMTLTLLLYSAGMLIFALILLGSVDIITFYISFEALSLLTYGVVATNKTLGSSEGALKYFIYGVISSVLLIFGLSLYYITFQSTDWYDVYAYENFASLGLPSEPFVLISITLVMLAFSYKLSMFPFHFSLPDVYEGSYWETIAIINLIVKLAISLSLFRVWGFLVSQVSLIVNTSMFLLTLSTASLIIGCFGALVQTSLKRLFAYTSINQAGFILLGLLTNSVVGLEASLLYLITYMLTMFVFFTGVSNTNSSVSINNFVELRNISTISKILVATSLFSMAGIPPFFGFIAKYSIWLSLIDGISCSVNNIYSILLIVAFLTSILVSLIGAYYYLRLIKIYVFSESSVEIWQISSFKSLAVLLSVVILIILGVGWAGVAEEIYSIFKLWAIDNYGSWINYIHTGWYVEWLRS